MAKDKNSTTERKIIKKDRDIEKRRDYGEKIQEGYDELPDPTPPPPPQPPKSDKK